MTCLMSQMRLFLYSSGETELNQLAGGEMNDSIKSLNIRPGVGFLSLLPHLNYKPWFALAEFVDNSLQSFLDYRNDIGRIEGTGCKLKVSIELDASV